MGKILVTGGLGFIGSNLIKLLLKKKYIVLNIDKVTYASNFYNTHEFKNNKKYKFLKCDLNNEKKLKKIFRSIKNNKTKGELSVQYMDYKKLDKFFGWRPKHKFLNTLPELVNWYKKYLKKD